MGISSVVAGLFLRALGWDPSIPPDLRMYFQLYPQIVVVFAHTSKWDFFFMLLYMLRDDLIRSRVRVLMKPELFRFSLVGWTLRRIGAIPATSIKQKDGGATNTVCQELQRQGNFIFLISPKGTVHQAEWKSGYFYIAHGTNAFVVAVGFNYITHRLEHGCVYRPLTPLGMTIQLQRDLAPITPLHPHRCEYTLAPYPGIPKVLGW